MKIIHAKLFGSQCTVSCDTFNHHDINKPSIQKTRLNMISMFL